MLYAGMAQSGAARRKGVAFCIAHASIRGAMICKSGHNQKGLIALIL